MEILLEDLRYVLRVFRRSPLFALVIVVTLAMGIGANTAIFSLVNTLLLKSLPVKNARELVVLGDPSLVHLRATHHPPHTNLFSYKLYTDLRDANSVFSEMLATCELRNIRVAQSGNARDDLITDQATGALVSGNYFSTLGVAAFAGRTLTPSDDDVPGVHPVAVISYAFWRNTLASDSNAVGRTLLVDDFPFTIVGIAQPGFFGDTVGDQQDVWFPVTMADQLVRSNKLLNNYKDSWFHILARLKPGVTIGEASANLSVIWQRLLDGPLGNETQYVSKEDLRHMRIDISDGRAGFSQLRSQYREPLILLMCIVALVLLIACANVANLLLARALARRREIAVRLALGAGASRIIRQLLTEHFLLAFAGGAGGLLVAHWGVALLLSLTRTTGVEVPLDARVLGVTAALCIASGLLFSLVPAARALDVSVASTLKSRSGAAEKSTGSPARWNWGKAVVAGQVALSVLVLFAGSLLVRSLKNLRNLDLGLRPQNLLIVRVNQIPAGYTSVLQRVQLTSEIARRLSALPGVQAVTYSQNGLYFNDEAADTIRIDGFVPRSSADSMCSTDRVGPGYFHTLGIPVLKGRELGEQDVASAPRVAVVNQAMERFYFGNESAIGRTLWITDDVQPDSYRIVGVVGDAKDHALRGDPARRYYVTMAQSSDAIGNIHFLVRTSGDPDQLGAAARTVVRQFDPKLPILSITSLDRRVDQSIRSEILVAQISGAFGVLALLLACLGLYGVISYMVSGKTRAIGVRIALGAQRGDVLRMVLGEAILLVAFGALAGIPAALFGGRLFSSMLYGVRSSDPSSLVAVVLLLSAIALLAAFIPARRAMNVDPIIALRDE